MKTLIVLILALIIPTVLFAGSWATVAICPPQDEYKMLALIGSVAIVGAGIYASTNKNARLISQVTTIATGIFFVNLIVVNW